MRGIDVYKKKEPAQLVLSVASSFESAAQAVSKVIWEARVLEGEECAVLFVSRLGFSVADRLDDLNHLFVGNVASTVG